MSSYVQQDRETEQILGTVAGAVQKSPENFQIQVIPDGSQNTRNLWTKDQEVVRYCMSQVGNRLAFLCNVSHWERNGQNVKSLWIDQIGAPTVGSPALAGPPMAQPPAMPAAQPFPPPAQPQAVVVQPQAQPMGATVRPQQEYLRPHSPEVQARIERQSAANVAAQLLAYLPEGERNLATLFVISERLRSYFESGVAQAETLDQLMQRAMPASMDDAASGQGYANTPPPHGDDDIPF